MFLQKIVTTLMNEISSTDEIFESAVTNEDLKVLENFNLNNHDLYEYEDKPVTCDFQNHEDDNLNVRSTKRKLAIEAILNLENRKYFKIESICVCN